MNTSPYEEYALSAVRATLAYAGKDTMYRYWNNAMSKRDILYTVFKDVNECPKQYSCTRTSAQAYSWIQGRTLYISFKGTEEFTDIIENLKFYLVKAFPISDPSILVHDGFFSQFQSIRHDIVNEITNAIELYEIDTFVCAGHSLGAGLATLASLLFAKQFKQLRSVCHTIGSPRVGNSAFVSLFATVVDESVRIVNTRDPVTFFPLSCFYTHTPNSITINTNCESIELYSDVHGCLRFFACIWGIDYCHPIVHHSCNVYISRLLHLAEWDIAFESITAHDVHDNDTERLL